MIRVVAPKERVDRLVFDPRVEFTEHVVHVGAYTCPRCKRETTFNTGNLRRATEAKVSPLGGEWDAACRGVRPLGAWEWALDFRCPGCASGVRIVYGHGGEFAMGCYLFDIVAVIEG